MSTGADGLWDWDYHVPVWVSMHMRAGSELTSIVHRGEGRVVLGVEGTNDARIRIFAGRTDLVRLIDAASAALHALDTGVATDGVEIRGEIATPAA